MAKAEIMKEILKVFPNSFLFNDKKEVRIPWMEDGEEVQIKVTLTAAKVAVEPGEDNALPTAAANKEPEGINFEEVQEKKDTIVKPTAEEKENVKKMLASLGL